MLPVTSGLGFSGLVLPSTVRGAEACEDTGDGVLLEDGGVCGSGPDGNQDRQVQAT